MVSKEEFQGWILDYACYHRISPIIRAISLRHAGRLDCLPVPQLRLACATIHLIIENEQLSQFDEAIKLVQQVNQAIPPLLVCQKTYMRLLTGLKIKALFQQLQKDSDKALVKLNAYFPRSTQKSKNPNQGQTFNQNYKNFRCFFFSLVSNENQLRAYLKDDYNAEFGTEFMKSMKKLCSRFLHQIESHLLPPMIEKVLACTECEKFSKMSPATEMLLDYVQEKKLSSQSDPSQQQSQEKGHRALLVFTEQELFEMLTVSCPLYTQDWLPRDHSLNLSSPDMFDSSGTQETLAQHYSQVNSPYVIVSNTQDSCSLVPLAAQQEGSSGNQSQECIQQLQQVSLVSQGELPVAHQTPSLKCAEQQSAMVQAVVRRSQLAPGDNQLICGLAAIEEEDDDDDGQSKLGKEAVQQGERIEEEMEHTGLQPMAVEQPQVPECQVQPMTRSRSQIEHGEVQPSKKKPKTIHRSQKIQDEVEPLRTELEANCTTPIPLQEEVSTEILTRQKPVQETVVLRCGVSERTLSPLPEILQEDKQQELVPTTSLQVMDDPLLLQNDPPNIISTPISEERGDKDDERRSTPLPPADPSFHESVNQPQYIRPWPGYVLRKPSYRLLRSKVCKGCNVNDSREGEMMVTPPGEGLATLEKKSPLKHSLATEEEEEEETSAQLCQTDKGCDTCLSSEATPSNSFHLSTDLSSISSGSSDIVIPSDSNSAEVFFMGTPDETIDSSYNFINKHLLKDVKACIIKLYRNKQLDVVDEEQVYIVYS